MFSKKLSTVMSVMASLSVSTLLVSPTIYFNQVGINNNIVDTNTAATTTNSFEPTLLNNNLNRDYESPNGVVTKKDANDGIIFSFYSYFNRLVWTYKVPKQKDNDNVSVVNLQNDFNTLVSADVKYNKFSNTFIIYGSYTSNTNAKKAFMYQVYAENGQNFTVNNNVASSIWVDNASAVQEIKDILLFGGERNDVLVIPKYENWNETDISLTQIPKVSFITYTTTNTTLSDLASHTDKIEAARNANYVIGSVFEMDNDGKFGMKIIDNTDVNNYFKFKYLFFDSASENLKLCGASSQWQSYKLSNKGQGKNYGALSAMKPFVFKSSTSKTFTIVETNVNPITNQAFDGSVAYLSERLWVTPVTWSDNFFNTKNLIISPSFIFTNKKYYVYQIKADLKNNLLFISLYQEKLAATATTFPTIDLSKTALFTVLVNPEDPSPSVTTQTNTLSTLSYTGKNTIWDFSVINDYSENSENPENGSLKSHVVKQVLWYDPIVGNNWIDTTKPVVGIYNSTRNSFSKTDSSTATSAIWNKGTDITWNTLVKENYTTLIDQSLYNKLPSDLSEKTIPTWIQYKSNNTPVDYATSTLETINSESDYTLSSTGKVLYNNENGTLKARVKTELSKWWYENPTSANEVDDYDKEIEYTNITLTGFATMTTLMFKLVINAEVDSTKWENIQNNYLNKKLPSQVTKQNILDDFIIHGNKITLTEEDITIVNGETTVAAAAASTTTAITVTYNDTDASLKISYDMTNKSSPSVNYSLIGEHTFIGFFDKLNYTSLELDVEKFNELKKTKLSHEFTVSDMLGVVKYSKGYNDSSKWSLTYTNSEKSNQEQYNTELIDGIADFVFKYERVDGMPSTLTDDNLKITINANSNGTGCKRLDSLIGGESQGGSGVGLDKSGIYFNEKYANSLAATLSVEDVNSNIKILLNKTISVELDWFNVSNLLPTKNEKLSSTTRAVYDLKLSNPLITNLNVSSDGINFEKLVLTDGLKNKLLTTRPSMLKINFQDQLQIRFNCKCATFNWNYDIDESQTDTGSQNEVTVDFDNLIEKVNQQRKENNLTLLPDEYKNASEFVKKYKNNLDQFQKDFQLISLPKIQSNSEQAALKSSSWIDTTDPSYFVIDDIIMFPNDQEGTVLLRYKLLYPNLNLESSFGTPVAVSTLAEITITGFPSSFNETSTILIISIAITLIIVIALIIWLTTYISFRRNKLIYQNKEIYSKKSLLEIYKRKVEKSK